jgi:ATP-dependent DNA helicase RecG
VLLDDLLEFQLGLALRRQSSRRLLAAPIPVTAQIDARIRRLFKFRFTPGQDQAVQQIVNDLALPQPMHRLLQADVGAGKTAIAVYAMLAAIAAGRQAVLMAPTEVLATQHWDTIDQLLAASRVNRCLLLGGLPVARRRELTAGITDGSIQLVIGTQALIQDSIRFSKLGVAVIDEQHRFGVRQRAGFSGQKHSADGLSPHVLVMTATPIPRSLCLTQFGDLDVSIIRDLPPGRQKVVTAKVSRPEELAKVWQFLRQQIDRGRQAYVVCPRVEGQSEDDAAAAETVFLRLRENQLQGLSVDLLHGRMEREHRHAVMDRFRDGQTQVLVSTTVIEVGVNIPNATIMVIQQAERFGIAQLHQLRGRICRGSHQGYCFLLSETETPDAANRLSALVQSSDGFELAEKDAQIRGPGDILGLRQSGAMPLRFADPVRDLELLQQARILAQTLVDSGDLNLPAFQPLRQIVLQRFDGLLDLPQGG